nr:universal stress protein [uncultured Sphingomonas sp.]
MSALLLHIQNDQGRHSRLESALALARATQAHLQCLHITPIEALIAYEGFGGVFVMNDVLTALQEQDERIRGEVEAKLSREDVPWDFLEATGHAAQLLIRHAGLADLIITGRGLHPQGLERSPLRHFGELLFGSETPLYIPADSPLEGDPIEIAAVAWDGGLEAANTVRKCLPLLRRARVVRVLRAEEDGKAEGFPDTRLLRYLSGHGIHAEFEQFEAPKEVIAPVLAERAREGGASYLLMGGYGHSRLGEFLFGGVTRTLLLDAPLPLIVGR